MSGRQAGPATAGASLETPAARPARVTARRLRGKHAALAAIVCVGLASATLLQSWSDNQSSHYDLIRALDAGRTTIDYGPYPTKDKAFYRGHWYSARAP